MGMTPSEVKRCSLWEFVMAAEGFRKANNPEEEGGVRPPTEDEFFARLEELGLAT